MSLEKPNSFYKSNLDNQENDAAENGSAGGAVAADKDPVNSDEENSKEIEELKKGIEEFKNEAENMLRSNKFMFESFSDSVTPKLKFSEGVKMDFETMTIHLDTDFFYNKGFTEKQMLWAAYHELAHFKDLISDPHRFMENFKHIREKAEEYGKKIRQITGEPERQFTEEEKSEGKVDPATAQAYSGWHTFYNCLDDIYVNSLVDRGIFAFSKKGRDHGQVGDLYSKVLFEETDYSQLPKSRQFTYSLLRKAMVPDQELTLTPEISEVLQREIKFAGKKMTVEEMIGMVQSKTRRGVKAGDRYYMIKKTLEPIFEELYNQDLEEWKKRREEKEEQKKQEQENQKEQDVESGSESQEGEGDPGDPGDPFDQEFDPKNSKQPKQTPNLPDFPLPKDLNEKDIEDIVNQIEDFKNNPDQKPEKPSKEEQGKERARKIEEQIQKWCDENQVERKTLEKYEKVQSEISPYLAELSKVWDSIIHGKGINFERAKEARNEGEINVSRFIKYFPDIQAGRMREVKPMDRKVMKQLPAEKPEMIRVRFVGDASGSMTNDPLKHEVLEKVYVLIMTSLRDFETKLNRTRTENHSKLSVQTEGWLFGDEAVRIKEFRKGHDYQSEYSQIIRQFGLLRQNLGWTCDSDAYNKIRKEITPREASETKSGKIMDLILEVTDGVPTDKKGNLDTESVANAVKDVEQTGSVVRAFQIGNVGEEEQEIFKKVWNNDKKERGYVVGKDIENLVPAVKEALKQYMSNVRI